VLHEHRGLHYEHQEEHEKGALAFVARKAQQQQRGHTGEPQKFKSGLYTLATLFPEVVLVPAWIDNVQRVMPKGEIVPVPILCSVTFGAPIRVEEGEERRPFLDRARAAVIALRDV
jgi:hypothetical protein